MLFALYAVLVLGSAILVLWAQTHRPRPPLVWTHVGTPPPGADEALEVLAELFPRARGGTITWVDEPWPDPYEPRWMIRSLVTSFRRWTIRSVRDVYLLPHEVEHLDRGSPQHTAESIRRDAYATARVRERLG